MKKLEEILWQSMITYLMLGLTVLMTVLIFVVVRLAFSDWSKT